MLGLEVGIRRQDQRAMSLLQLSAAVAPLAWFGQVELCRLPSPTRCLLPRSGRSAPRVQADVLMRSSRCRQHIVAVTACLLGAQQLCPGARAARFLLGGKRYGPKGTPKPS